MKLRSEGTAFRSPQQHGFLLLSATPDTELQLPERVSIPAGQTVAVVAVLAIDDPWLDGPREVVVSGVSDGLPVIPGRIRALDNETATLSLQFPGELEEGEMAVAQVSVDRAPDQDVVVYLETSPPGLFTSLPTVLLPAGQTNLIFNVPTENDWLDGLLAASLSVQVDNWVPATVAFTLFDNESPQILLSTPASLAENAGVLTDVCGVTLGGKVRNDLNVSLVTAPPGRLQVPSFVPVPFGQSNVLFSLAVVDNVAQEGTVSVEVSAFAPGLGAGQSTVRVLDDDPAAYQFDLVQSPQFVGVPITTRVQALDALGDPIMVAYHCGSHPGHHPEHHHGPAVCDSAGRGTATRWHDCDSGRSDRRAGDLGDRSRRREFQQSAWRTAHDNAGWGEVVRGGR